MSGMRLLELHWYLKVLFHGGHYVHRQPQEEPCLVSRMMPVY